MKRRISYFAFVLLFPILATTVSGADRTRRIAIMPFENLNKNDKTMDWIGAGIAETLTTELGRIRDLTLVERSQLNEALKEIKLGQSGVVDTATAQKAGRAIGADSVVIGSY